MRMARAQPRGGLLRSPPAYADSQLVTRQTATEGSGMQMARAQPRGGLLRSPLVYADSQLVTRQTATGGIEGIWGTCGSVPPLLPKGTF